MRIQDYLNKQNPLLTNDFEDLFWKKYKVSNYKWITITDEKWVKIDKQFTNNDEAIKYLESLNPTTCDVTIKKFISADSIVNQKFPERKKFSSKYRIVNFKTLWKCKKLKK